jgi:hypothetical protein
MSWEQLLEVYELDAYERANPPQQSCPNDGEPYKVGPDGLLFCPNDGYRPDAWTGPPGVAP